jgi:hypothetical protein
LFGSNRSQKLVQYVLTMSCDDDLFVLTDRDFSEYVC